MCSCSCNNRNRSNSNTNTNTNSINFYSDSYGVSGMNCSPFPVNYLYGHAYTPNQIMNKTFEPSVGLSNGTIFPELVSPYCPGQSIDFINYLRNGGI